jgi:ribonuclease HI
MWQETKKGLYKKFTFKSFREAFTFMQEVALVAEMRQHHPKWTNEYNVVEIWLSTHDAGDTVTEKDEQLAAEIDRLALEDKGDSETSQLNITKAKLFGDGGSRGNPGPAAYGYVILDMDDKVVKQEGVYIGDTTNNQAEYQSLKYGLESALALGVKELEVYMDSQLVINQINGLYKIRNVELKPHYERIKILAQEFDQISFTHVPRELNKLADAMVNQALDARIA